MPSPLAHAAMGYTVYRVIESRVPPVKPPGIKVSVPLWVATIGLSLVPDIDALIGILAGDIGNFHNNIMNSFAVGGLVALGLAITVWLCAKAGFRTWFAIAMACYGLHIVMDYFTLGRGVMALWPLTADRLQPPLVLFYGLHWSDGLWSIRHLWTLLTEAAFALLLVLPVHFRTRRHKQVPETGTAGTIEL